MFERLRNWLRRGATISVDESEVSPYEFDEAMISLAMLRVLLLEGTDREAVADALRVQFAAMEHVGWPDRIEDVLNAIPDVPLSGKVLAAVAYSLLASNKPIEEFREIFDNAFAVPGADDLPEVREARRRMSALLV